MSRPGGAAENHQEIAAPTLITGLIDPAEIEQFDQGKRSQQSGDRRGRDRLDALHLKAGLGGQPADIIERVHTVMSGENVLLRAACQEQCKQVLDALRHQDGQAENNAALVGRMEHENALGPQNPPDFGENLGRPFQVLNHHVGGDDINASRAERDMLEVAVDLFVDDRVFLEAFPIEIDADELLARRARSRSSAAIHSANIWCPQPRSTAEIHPMATLGDVPSE